MAVARRFAGAMLIVLRGAGGEDEEREKATAGLLSFGTGLSPEQAEERLEELENEGD